MCKYCKLKTYNEQCGEKTNDQIPFSSIKDGSQVFEVYMNRYIPGYNEPHESELVLDLAVKLGDELFNVKEKSIKIKYCPFCGEEL